MKQVLQKSLALASLIALLGGQSVWAIGPSIPSTSSVIRTVSGWFGIDQSSTKEVTAAAAVMANKGSAPQVKISFSPADPEQDEEVTALAAASNFNGTPENLYYTWYISKRYYDAVDADYYNCDDEVDYEAANDGRDEDQRLLNCDEDNDGKVTVNDWKIAAVRLQLANAVFSSEETCVGGAACNSTDDDGYIASFGGDGNAIGTMAEGEYDMNVFSDGTYHNGSGSDSGRAYQYLHDTQGGEDWELVDDHPPLADQAQASCSGAPIVALGGTYNQVPRCGKGTVLDDEDPVVEAELVYPSRYGLIELYIACEDQGEDPWCDENQNEWKCNSGIPVCAYDYNQGEYGDYLWTYLDASGSGSGTDTRIDAYTGSCRKHFSEPTAVDCGDRYTIKDALAFHMFAQPIWRGHDGDREKPCGDTTEATNDVTGDGKFTESEECFWGTDPQDPDTLDLGMKDEAVVAGKGLAQLTWRYQPGDRVGVIVEGNSMVATKHPDGSQEVMFALPNGEYSFLERNGVEAKYTTPYNAGSDYRTTLNIARGLMTDDEMDDALGVSGSNYKYLRPIFNKFLKANLTDPLAGGQGKKLEVDITHSPETPMNMAYANLEEGGASTLGDTLTLNANVSGAGMSDKKVEFDWSIKVLGTATQPARDVFENEDRWEDETGSKIVCTSTSYADCTSSFGLNRLKGGNLNKLELKLDMDTGDFEDDSAYMYVKVIVKETTGSSSVTSRNYSKGAGADLFRIINQGGKKIKAYRVTAEDEDDLVGSATEICTGGPDADDVVDLVLCPVLKNEIIKVDASELEDGGTFSSYSWTINGKAMDCDNGNCGNESDTVNFFAATGEPGTTYTVKVSGIGSTGSTTQQSKEMQRVFMVVKPSIEVSKAGLTYKDLGEYTDVDDGTPQLDKSRNVMLAESGTTVNLAITCTPSYLCDPAPGMIVAGTEKYKVDGLSNDINGDPYVAGSSFEVGQRNASGHLIEATAEYKADLVNRQALKGLWGVTQFESSGGRLDAKLAIEIDDGGCTASDPDYPDCLTKTGTSRFLASIIDNVPIQFLLVLRIMLTGLVVFVVMAVAFSAVPETNEKRY